MNIKNKVNEIHTNFTFPDMKTLVMKTQFLTALVTIVKDLR